MDSISLFILCLYLCHDNIFINSLQIKLKKLIDKLTFMCYNIITVKDRKSEKKGIVKYGRSTCYKGS